MTAAGAHSPRVGIARRPTHPPLPPFRPSVQHNDRATQVLWGSLAVLLYWVLWSRFGYLD